MIKDLPLTLKENVLRLLEKPYAGSKVFSYNHNADYVSNCHGTMAYVFGLEHPLFQTKGRPRVLPDVVMEELIRKYFVVSSTSEIGSLIAFYMIHNGDELLCHAALLIGGNLIFHQSGCGGVFEQNAFDSRLRHYSALNKPVGYRAYSLR